MITLILAVVLTMVVTPFIIKTLRKRNNMVNDVRQKIVEATVEVREQDGINVHYVTPGSLLIYGGACCIDNKMVALEEGVDPAVLQHELRHARRNHTLCNMMILVYLSIVTSALPILLWFNWILAVALYVSGWMIQGIFMIVMELDADRVPSKYKESMVTFLEGKVKEYNEWLSANALLRVFTITPIHIRLWMLRLTS